MKNPTVTPLSGPATIGIPAYLNSITAGGNKSQPDNFFNSFL